ncbi:hypothetical protein H9L39_13617 [Fusarium oxysporum f. sp. albedinis]|nr:hypothetical protein H9L39_13617 [Fusarium oxysporum f. sp. albedinis]
MIQRLGVNGSDLVILNSKDFADLIAIIQLFFKAKMQVHGNWVDSATMETANASFMRPWKVSGEGAMDSHF